MTVKTAIFYAKENYVENPLELLEILEKDKGGYYNDNKKQVLLDSQVLIDSRSRKWTKLSLKEIVNPLLLGRQKLKNLRE